LYENVFLQLANSDESHWKYNMILYSGFQSSPFQSFAPEGWLLDFFGSFPRRIAGYPASSIKHQASSHHTGALILSSHEKINRFMHRQR